MRKNILMSVLIVMFGLIPTNTYAETSDDKIHFIATGSSDAILIESNGRFGLVDAAEDTGTSRTRAPQSEIDAIKNLKGYEDVVVKYLKDQGVETLDFAIATHAHSDHIGGMDTVLSEFKVNKLYTREYKDTYKDSSGKTQQIFYGKYEYTWDNQEVYDDMIRAAQEANTKIIFLDGDSSKDTLNFSLGDFKIQIVNNRLYNSPEKEKNIVINSENSNSLGVVVSKNNKRAFLAGDIENSSIDNDEKFLITNAETKNVLKNVDLLKMPHHGFNGSEEFINYLNPKKIVVTGYRIYDELENVKSVDKNNIYTTGEYNDVIANFTDENTIEIKGKHNGQLNEQWILNDDGIWHFGELNGKKAIGWNELYWNEKKDWYYFNASGQMVTGWKKIEGNWYYFAERTIGSTYRGCMLTGWQRLDWNGKVDWYYFNASGQMVTGWQQLDWYGKVDWYYFNASGQMVTGWQQLEWNGSKHWYYFADSTTSSVNKGAMLTGTHNLYWNGVQDSYTFNSDGSLK